MSNSNQKNNSPLTRSFAPSKSKNLKHTFRRVLKSIEGNKTVIALSIFFSFIGVFLSVFAVLSFGQIVSFFFTPPSPSDILGNTSQNIPGGSQDGKSNWLLMILTWGYRSHKWQAFLAATMNIAISYLVFAISSTIQNIIMIRISQKTSVKLRKEVFYKLQTMPISYFDSHQSGDLMSRMTNDIDNISQGLSQSLSQFVQSGLTIIISLIIMMIMSSYLTLITIGLLPILMFVSIVFIKKSQPHFIEQQSKIGDLNGYIEEMISGQKMTNLLNRQEHVAKDFSKYNNSLVKSAVYSQTYSGFMFPWLGFVTNILLLAISCISVAFAINNIDVGGIGGLVGGKIGVADVAFLSTFTLFLRNLINPIGNLLGTMNIIQAGIAGAERVYEIIDLKPLGDSKNAKELTEVKGHVEFKNVNFGYTPEKLNLKNANITAKPGEVIAIVGPTGAGKTTVINLLTKFYRYNDGQIFIDNHEINEIKEKSWRDNISIVLQDTFLFNDSIRENIRYGNLSATDEEVEEAAKIANAHMFITQLEHGYDTVLDSSGGDLSQGQRQLLAIARAVISKSSILILDEATSSVDTRTEIHIQTAMLRLMKGRTSFVIAHRLSTIKNADQILVIKDGEIIEKGNHNSLLKIKNGFYANLYNSQFKNGVISE